MTATAMPHEPKVTWRAGSDRIAHAHLDNQPRTLCGELVLGERFAWTKFRNCMVCAASVEQRFVAGLPEGEARALWGDR